MPLLFLIDGIDEDEGNMRKLLDKLLAIGKHPNVKLCLASRPGPMIQALFKNLPSIDMVDYNQSGIEQYINFTIHKFQPRLELLDLDGMQEMILERAQGVFLWVFLALEEIVAACVNGSTALEIKALLQNLPQELAKRAVQRC